MARHVVVQDLQRVMIQCDECGDRTFFRGLSPLGVERELKLPCDKCLQKAP